MRVLLIDGTNLAVRAAHAGSRVTLSATDGVPTATLLIFINMLSRHIREENPTHVVVAWDGGKSEYRKRIWAEYKAARHANPSAEPERPMDQIKEFCTLAGMHHVERAGFEADDIIANYWHQIRPLGTDLVIVSGDKDFLQLVDRNCILVRPMNNAAPTDRWTYDRMVEEVGCKPADFANVKALMGDTSDGIPGLKGIGPKKAVKMLATNDWSWLRVIDHYGLPQEDRDLINRNLMLMDLRNCAPHTPLGNPPEFNPTTIESGAGEALLKYLGRYGLASVVDRLVQGTLWKDSNGEA